MKTRIAAGPRRQLDVLLDTFFYCPSCTTWRLASPSLARPRVHLRQRRDASTLNSSTAINATKAVPPRFKDLYEAVGNVKRKASGQVNLSRLQLALQGLESETPTTRVAVLGLNVETTARRLVRLLLADALNAEEKWEKQLVKDGADYSQGLLIRYGQPHNTSLPQPKSVVPILRIPASVLQRNRIEILVSAVNASAGVAGSKSTPSTTSDAFLSPMIGAPADANGRTISLSQPVHRSLLAAQGLDELVAIAELLASTNFTTSDRQLVDVVVNMDNPKAESMKEVLIVDTMKAEEGLSAIRASLKNATTYEHDWMESGMPALSKWLTLASASKTAASLPAPVRNLIASLLASASANLEMENIQAAQAAAARSLNLATRSSLEDALSEFSRQAHQELQSGLASAWTSRNWRKLAWYKLFWRVDDVGLIIADLVSNSWLPETERSVYELSGRLIQAGISPVATDFEPARMTMLPEMADADVEKPLLAFQPQGVVAGQILEEPVLVNQGGKVTVELKPVPRPVPIASTISSARQAYMYDAITDLTTTAQQLVFRTLTITGLTAGLSGLAYFSVAAGSIYEAGTIVALGTAYALRTMQTDWQKSCKMLEGGLMDTGREVIRRIEERMRSLILQRGAARESEIEVLSRKEAGEAISSAKECLKRLG